MKISFRDNGERTESKIFVNNKFIGVVKSNIWEKKWTLHPEFNWTGDQAMLYEKHDSSYKAGKAMARMHEKILEEYAREYDEHGVNPLEDTDEFEVKMGHWNGNTIEWEETQAVE